MMMDSTPANSTLRGPLAWMAGNSVAANLIMLFFLVGGLYWGAKIKQEVFPAFELDYIRINVSYPGAGPEEVEQGIILAIEEAISALDDIKEITAVAEEGNGRVTVEAVEGTDLERLAQDIKSSVDRIGSFPEDVEEPSVKIASRRREVVSLVLYGDQKEHILREFAEQIRDQLQSDPGITQVEFSGIRPFEISIEIPLANLRAYHLTLEDVARRIREAAVELPGGGIKTSADEILLRINERRDYGVEFAQLPIITTQDGSKVLLEDIAEIKDDFKAVDRYATYNNQPAMMIDVYRIGNQTPITVADATQKVIKEIRPNLPKRIAIDTLNDRSEVYRQRLHLLLKNAYLGLGLVLVLLGLFLDRRLAFWVSLGIPISFLGALLFMPQFNVSINMITLFAFIIALGIVVDDAIVVGENIYRYQQQGYPPMKAAVTGVREMAMPVTFAVLTNILTFLPLLFVPGFMGKIFYSIPIVVIAIFSISLIESLLILPAHLAHLSHRKSKGILDWAENRQKAFSDWFQKMVATVYGPMLSHILSYRYITFATGIFVLILSIGYIESGRIGMTMFPKEESDYAVATAALPYGSSVAKTKDVEAKLLAAAQKVARENGGRKLVQGIFAEIGAPTRNSSTTGGHVSEITVFLTSPEKRPISTGAFIQKWRNAVGRVPGLESLIFQSDRGGPGSGAALTVELSHRNLDILKQASSDLSDTLTSFPNVKDIDDGYSIGKQQINFKILPKGQAIGFTAREVARQIRNSFYGIEVMRQQRGRNEVTVSVRLPGNERDSEYHIEEFLLKSLDGTEVPLRDVVKMQKGHAYTQIDRRSGRRVITVSADVTPRRDTDKIVKALNTDILPRLKDRYPSLNYGFEGHQADRAESMRSLFNGLLTALLAIYALLAIPFRSYIQPMIIMVGIPFGIVGAIIGHMIMGYNLSIVSMFGIVALSGVVINDALVFINTANVKRNKEGLSAKAALIASGIQRFRPILLTTLTTFGGLSPMIFETSLQARLMIPMAISLGYGILFATLITLILIPTIYLIVEDLKNLFGLNGKQGDIVPMEIPSAGNTLAEKQVYKRTG
jgi:multidrug efflux pump subunit AcrB